MSRIFYLHLGPWNSRLEPGPIGETRSSFHWKHSQIQSLNQEILLAHNWNVHNFIQTKQKQLFTPVGTTTPQCCWQALILTPLGQLSLIYPTRPNLQASSATMGIQKPSGPHHSSQSIFLFISLKHREERPIFEVLWRVSCFLLYFYHLSSGKKKSWMVSKHKLSISFWHVTHPSKTRGLFSLTSFLWPMIFPLLRTHTPASAIPAPQDSAQPLLL